MVKIVKENACKEQEYDVQLISLGFELRESRKIWITFLTKGETRFESLDGVVPS